MSVIPLNNGSAPSKSGLCAMIGVAAAAVAGTAAFMENIDKIGSGAHKLCQELSMCAADPAPTPTLAPFDSGTMDGGHDQKEVCGPRLEAYKAQYPNFNISFTAQDGGSKDWLGHVTYSYHCNYVATPK